MRFNRRLKGERYIDDVFFELLEHRSKELAEQWTKKEVEVTLGEEKVVFNLEGWFTINDSKFDYNFFHIKSLAESLLKDKV